MIEIDNQKYPVWSKSDFLHYPKRALFRIAQSSKSNMYWTNKHNMSSKVPVCWTGQGQSSGFQLWILLWHAVSAWCQIMVQKNPQLRENIWPFFFFKNLWQQDYRESGHFAVVGEIINRKFDYGPTMVWWMTQGQSLETTTKYLTTC